MSSLGARVKKIRTEKGLTQGYLAERLGMGRSNVGHIENGRTIPTAEALDKIADILGTTTDYLLGRTDNPYRYDNKTSQSESIVAEDKTPYYALTDKDERDIAKKLEAMMNDLDSDSSLSFMGEPMDEDDRELLRISLENTLRMSREMAKKKFTPNKYRK
ncbi:helix-turn-helix transcriptional regulator [Paenibacillus cisolokensis]|uniref:helix-turn-helix domain-containing protein n=1 Tax=Paenibacillus cisolokensis TaxID=1658519 RepID=UPI003D2D71AE